MRKLSLVIAGILGAGGPLISQAATLGEARVESNLTEPLQVVVPLARSSNESLDELSVQLAPASFYREAGVPLDSLDGNLTFAIRSDRNGEYVLIGSKHPIRDPILSVLLQVSSPEGRMIRKFNLLLDPPATTSTASSSEQVARSGTADRQTTAPASRATSTWQRPASVADVELTDTYQVQSGDTLYEIAREHVGEGEDVRPLMQAIVDANPQAFRNGNGNAMMAGANLQVPASRGQPGSAEDSQQTGQAGSTMEGNRLPALELLSPEEKTATETAPASVGGFGDLSVSNRLPAIAGSPSETAGVEDGQGALDREEMESIRAENEALTDQLRALKDQIDSVQVSITDRDAQIAELQSVVDQAQAQARELEALRGNFWLDWGKYLTGILGLIIIALLIALGLKGRNRDRDEPAVAMPITAASGSQQPAPHAEPASESREADGGQIASATTASVAAAEATQSEPTTSKSDQGSFNDDPMNPEMALEESRVLESFNLTHQALELLQDSLAEHPGHSGLQEAINRLNDQERGTEQTPTAQAEAPGNQPASQDDSVMAEEAGGDTTSLPEEPTDQDEESLPGEETPRAPDAEAPGGSAESTSSGSGSIEWDNDLDDMLATPEPESTRETAGPDESLMEFDDSYALETPIEDPDLGATKVPPETRETESTASEVSAEDEALGLPDFDLEPVEGTPGSATEETTDDELSLNAPGLEPLEREESAPTEMEPPQETEPTETDSSATDTRVGLAEAFLDVGDEESFEMIKSELQEEGATEALERLENLKQRRAGG